MVKFTRQEWNGPNDENRAIRDMYDLSDARNFLGWNRNGIEEYVIPPENGRMVSKENHLQSWTWYDVTGKSHQFHLVPRVNDSELDQYNPDIEGQEVKRKQRKEDIDNQQAIVKSFGNYDPKLFCPDIYEIDNFFSSDYDPETGDMQMSNPITFYRQYKYFYENILNGEGLVPANLKALTSKGEPITYKDENGKNVCVMLTGQHGERLDLSKDNEANRKIKAYMESFIKGESPSLDLSFKDIQQLSTTSGRITMSDQPAQAPATEAVVETPEATPAAAAAKTQAQRTLEEIAKGARDKLTDTEYKALIQGTIDKAVAEKINSIREQTLEEMTQKIRAISDKPVNSRADALEKYIELLNAYADKKKKELEYEKQDLELAQANQQMGRTNALIAVIAALGRGLKHTFKKDKTRNLQTVKDEISRISGWQQGSAQKIEGLARTERMFENSLETGTLTDEQANNYLRNMNGNSSQINALKSAGNSPLNDKNDQFFKQITEDCVNDMAANPPNLKEKPKGISKDVFKKLQENPTFGEFGKALASLFSRLFSKLKR